MAISAKGGAALPLDSNSKSCLESPTAPLDVIFSDPVRSNSKSLECLKDCIVPYSLFNTKRKSHMECPTHR